MARQYDHWVHTQLEPNDRIIVGNAKRFESKRKIVTTIIQDVQLNYEEDKRSEEEKDREQDEYLKSKGIF